MNIINVDINFKDGINKLTGINLITGDYASTKMVFNFDRTDGTKVLEMKNPSGQLVYDGEILNNEVLLCAVEDGHNYSIFNQEGRYIYEISLYKGDSKLTSVKGELPVQKEQVIIDGEIVEPYLPIFDQLMQDIETKIEEADLKIETINQKIDEVNTAIEETNNLNIDVSDKVDKDVTITLTKKDNTTKSVVISDGTSLQFVWQGTSLGIKTDDMQDYVFVDLQGIQGVPGPQGEPFRIKKTYPSVQAMNDDFNNMNYGDYVMIATSVEIEDNAKLYTKTPTEWVFISDFSGATGIKGEKGDKGEQGIQGQQGIQGIQGEQGEKGDTGNGIASIVKTSTSGLVDTYTITYTDGTTTTYEVTNGEDGEVTQAQLDEVIEENTYLNNVINQLPRVNGTGNTITLDNTIEAKMKCKLSPSEMEQNTTIGKNIFSGDFSQFDNQGGEGTTYAYFKLPDDGETYTLSLIAKNDYVGNETTYIGFTEKGGTAQGGAGYNWLITATTNITKGTIRTYSTNEMRFISIYANSTITFNRIMDNFYVQLEKSATRTDYEPYTGGIASPNPQYQQDIHTTTGDNSIKVEGKNLFNGSKFPNATNNGISLTKNSNNEIVLNGTATAQANFNTDYLEIPSGLSQVTLSGGTSNVSFSIVTYTSDKTYISTGRDSGSGITYSIPSNAVYYVVNVRVASGVTLNNYVLKAQIEKNTNTATSYEPYTLDTYSLTLGSLEYSKIPNSDYEDEFIIPSGKNLFDKDSATYKNGYIKDDNGNEISSGASGYLTSYISVEPNTKYTLSGTLSQGGQTIRIYYYDNSKSWISRTSSLEYATSYTFTTPANCYYMQFQYIQNFYNANTIQIEKGNFTSYEPYNNGKWYLKKNMLKINLGDLDYSLNTTSALAPYFYASVNNVLRQGAFSDAYASLCSDYKIVGRNSNDFVNYTSCFDGSASAVLFVTFKNSDYNDALQFKNSLNNKYMYVPAIVPTYIPLNDTLQEQLDTIYNLLKSYKGQTNISQVNNDLPFNMSASALLDLNTLVGD